jgi:hypothetical protein
MKQSILVFLILFLLQGCMTTKMWNLENPSAYNDLNSGKKEFLIIYNQNNQYELRNYRFRKDSLEGELFVPKIQRSVGLMVYTDNDFRIMDSSSSPVVRIPQDKILKIQEVKTDVLKSVAFIGGVAIITMSLWWAGNAVLGGMF